MTCAAYGTITHECTCEQKRIVTVTHALHKCPPTRLLFVIASIFLYVDLLPLMWMTGGTGGLIFGIATLVGVLGTAATCAIEDSWAHAIFACAGFVMAPANLLMVIIMSKANWELWEWITIGLLCLTSAVLLWSGSYGMDDRVHWILFARAEIVFILLFAVGVVLCKMHFQ